MTPMMKQYRSIKEKHRDAILFYRLGDFYEMFYDDAITASKELEIALTQRDAGGGKKAPMCGVPYHAYEGYLETLVRNGYKVAIVEQLEDPSQAKGIVKRDVVRIVTPGTIFDRGLDEKTNNFLASCFYKKNKIALSLIDNSTGELFTTELEGEDSLEVLITELKKYKPSEVLANYELQKVNLFNKYIKDFSPSLSFMDFSFTEEDKEKILSYFFNEEEKDKLNNRTLSKSAVVTTLAYLTSTQNDSLVHINKLTFYTPKSFMEIDYSTRANLEISETLIGRKKKGSLLSVIDRTETAMGGRLLRKFLDQPLIDMKKIEERLNFVDIFYKNERLNDELRELLKEVYDLERITSKIASSNGNARDVSSLSYSISKIPEILKLLSNFNELQFLTKIVDDLKDIYDRIDKTIVDNPPITITEGKIIKESFSREIYELKDILANSNNMLLHLEEKERKNSGIKNLKIGFNKPFGYFFEITKSNLKNVPEHFIRRQTLTNCERFFTDELKELERKKLNAQDEITELEYRIFIELRDFIKEQTPRIQKTAHFIAEMDVFSSLAKVAIENEYTKPNINNTGEISIIEGRHPVVEYFQRDIPFITNDTNLGINNQTMQIITGPNMSGKSTYMRQVALITLMAHIGSFVPASQANISVTDKIFTRIGAADNLSSGESTFMVEMKEVSNILNNATVNSLLILDEVGRGTSTYDGLSIAWSVCEYIVKNIKAKTLFATHYHELTQLKESHDEITNLTISVIEKNNEVIFLRKLVEGITNKSYGIEVAKLAGIKKEVIENAKIILKMIEKNHKIIITSKEDNKEKQLDFNNYKKEHIIDMLKDLNVEKMSQEEAHNLLKILSSESKKIRGYDE